MPPSGPFTHAYGYRACSRCGIKLAGPWPEGTLLTAVGDGRWRVVEGPTLERPVCPLAVVLVEPLRALS